MPQLETPEVTDVLERIASWPAEKRRNLAERILHGLDGERPSPVAPRRSLRVLLGLLKTDGSPPTDEECQRILEDELIRKHFR